MSAKKNITIGQIKDAITKCGGVISLVSNELGCGRKNVYDRIEKTPKLKEHLLEVKERTNDVAENIVINAMTMGVVYRQREIKKGKDKGKKVVVPVEIFANEQIKTAKWYLERKGKDRGYNTRHEVVGANDEPLVPKQDLSNLNKEELETLYALNLKVKGN